VRNPSLRVRAYLALFFGTRLSAHSLSPWDRDQTPVIPLT
jgi:hypothetical protein